MNPKRIPLGPYTLHGQVGRGGMGEVWAGEHVGQGLAVAVKLITAPGVAARSARESLAREARAVAALDHEHVVSVYDLGEVSPEDAGRSAGALTAGTPYLVMELVRGGTLVKERGLVDRSRLFGVLRAVLRALAHAHARGVLHRDLKPGNVLVDARTATVRVTDFGLARILDPQGDGELQGPAGGTLAYLAPEQAAGRLRDQGPWTDLYALGCMVHALVEGEPPFGVQRTAEELVAYHVLGAAPRLLLPGGLPLGVLWLAVRLLAKEPRDRFRRAADALAALELLADAPASGGSATPKRPPPPPPSWVPPAPLFAETTRFEDPAGIVPPVRTPRPAPASSSVPRAPREVPDDWRDDQLERLRPRLASAGLGLVGIRNLPLVGRESERDRLWAAFCAAELSGGIRAVVLEGRSGTGKTRLAQWLGRRAHELGLAQVLTARHAALPGRAHGAGPMIERHLGCTGLARVEVQERVRRALAGTEAPPQELEGLTELIRPATATERASGLRAPRLGRASEQHALIDRVVRRAARERPVIAILDDVQWGDETLELARALLAAPDPGPGEHAAPRLLVLTLRAEEGAEAVDSLGPAERVDRIDVGPLAPADRPALVRALLGLDGAAAAEVEERTGGHPLFAVQLVGYWAERGLLVPGTGGHQLRAGAAARVPVDLRALWSERVQDLLAQQPPSDRSALELAAALGADVDADEWRRALRAAGLSPSTDLVDRLVGAGLADWRADGSGWSFAHGVLVDALRHSCTAGRWADLNRVCAAVLSDSEEPDSPERRGRHLLAAGETAAACDLLLSAAGGGGREGGFRRQARLLDERDTALDLLGLGADDPARLEGQLLRARLTTRLGDPAAGERLAAAAEEGARVAGREDLIADALLVRGKTRGILGDQSLAREHLEEATTLFEGLGDELGGAACALQRGVTFTREGTLSRADASIREALEVYERLDESYEAAIACGHLSIVAHQAGRLDEAEVIVERGLRPAVAHGHRHVAANLHIALGEVLRIRGDLDRAERAYGAAMAIYRSFGTADLGLLECNLAQIHTARGRFAEARALLTPTLATFDARGRANRGAATRILLLPCEAHDRRWAAFDQHIERATEVFSTTHYAELDIAVAAEQAAQIAAAAGQVERAAAAWELAAVQWDALERPEDALRVRAEER